MKRLGVAAVAVICLLVMAAPPAQADISSDVVLPDGTHRTTYRVGPLNITSGQNRINNKTVVGSERPAVDGWITHITPNLVYAGGIPGHPENSIPSSSKIMFHHGVWINGATGERFFATGEEKTDLILPPGYGYRYKKNEPWILNHMIHNLVPEATQLYITYTVDFVPDTLPLANTIKRVNTLWTDVENGRGYPVFDTHRGSGGADGEFTYPQDDPNAYPPGRGQPNEITIPHDGVLLATTGHVHTGGLSTNLYLKREGASYGGEICPPAENFDGELAWYVDRLSEISAKEAAIKQAMPTAKLKKVKKSLRRGNMKKLRKKMKPAKFKRMKRLKIKYLKKLTRIQKAKRKQLDAVTETKNSVLADQKTVQGKDEAAKGKYQACLDTQPQVTGNRVHLFESAAKYFEPAGPVSWDMAMLSTPDDWRVGVKQGDTLELQTTYETERASWYENMGINIVYWSPETDGDNPYVTKVDRPGVPNHGHYAENDDHGGTTPLVGPDPATLPNGLASGGPFEIGNYVYAAGNFTSPASLPSLRNPPVVKKGNSFTFKLASQDQSKEIWHSLTSCKSPCNKSTGIAYPIADGEFQFDSGQLGLGGDPTVNRDTWSTPANLPVGTHTFFCRIHPLMRGAVRVVN